VPITFPSLDMNTFLAGGVIGDTPAELMFDTKVGAIGRTPAVRTTDTDPSGLVIRLIIVGVLGDPIPAGDLDGGVIIMDDGLFGFGS
jgi:hypothetical protein